MAQERRVSTTIIGTVTRLRGLAATYDAAGRIVGGSTTDDVAHALGGNTITAEHDPDNVAGVIVHAELDDGGRVRVVGVLDNDRIRDVPEPVYLSGSWDQRGRGD